MSSRRRLRRFFLEGSCWLAGAISVAAILGIVATIVSRGASAISIEFLTTPSFGDGSEGGILHQIVGTCWMTLVAGLIVVPLSTGLALLLTVLARPALVRVLRPCLDALNAVPSILFGIFGFYLFVKVFGWGKSWLAGSILLAMMITPTVTVSWADAMRSIPREYLVAARGLGLSRGRVALAVVLPQSLHGLWSGLLLGLARAAGETAPIMFTAVVLDGVDSLPRGIVDNPVLALPYHIFMLSQGSYDPGAVTAAWGTALVLFSLVLALFAASLPLRLRVHEEARA